MYFSFGNRAEHFRAQISPKEVRWFGQNEHEYWKSRCYKCQKPWWGLATEQWFKGGMGKNHWNRSLKTWLLSLHLKIHAQLLEASPKHLSFSSFLLLHSSLTVASLHLHPVISSVTWLILAPGFQFHMTAWQLSTYSMLRLQQGKKENLCPQGDDILVGGEKNNKQSE